MTLALSTMIAATLASGESSKESTKVYEATFARFGVAKRTYFIRAMVQNPLEHGLNYPHKEILARLPAEGRAHRHGRTDFGNTSVHLIAEEEYIDLFSDGCREGWQRFHQRYPQAKEIFGLSSVGFTADGTEAVVYVERASDCLNGIGTLVVFERSRGNWKTKRTLTLWVS